MRRTISSAVALAGLACSTAVAQLDGVSYSGGDPVWQAVTLSPNQYVALALVAGGASNQVFGARAGGGFDVVANYGYGSGWQTYPITNGNYRALAPNPGLLNYAFAAKVGGGVDAVYFDYGGDNVWEVAEINPHEFVSLASMSTANQFIGVRSDGRLEFTYYSGGGTIWNNYILEIPDLYRRIIRDPMKPTSVYGLRADGGIDRVTFNGSSWVTTVVDHSRDYVALTAERTIDNWIYGATASGLYDLVDTGGGFSAYLVSTNAYKAIEHITGTTYQLHGARADGSGLDAIYFDGGIWTSYLANPNNYDILLHDAYTAGLYAAAPVPSAPPAVTGIGLLPDQNISLTVTGAIGTAWSLRATSDLTLPRPWPVIQTGGVTTSPFTVDDLTATNYPQRFYQISTP